MEGRRAQQRAAVLPTDPGELRVAIAREPHGDRSPADEDFEAVRRLYLREERVGALPDDAPSIPGPPCLPGQPSIMREVQPGLTHATGRSSPNS